jgi:hypothetical protein
MRAHLAEVLRLFAEPIRRKRRAERRNRKLAS